MGVIQFCARYSSFITAIALFSGGCAPQVRPPPEGALGTSASTAAASATKPAAHSNSSVEKLITECRPLVEQGRFAEGRVVLRKILALDDMNDYALGVGALLGDYTVGQGAQDRFMPRPPGSPDTRPAYPVANEERACDIHLNRKLPEVNLDQIWFEDAVEFVCDATMQSVFFEWKVLEHAGIRKNIPVTLHLVNVKWQDALAQILKSVSTPEAVVDYTIVNGVIWISTPKVIAADVSTQAYDLRDLLVDEHTSKQPTNEQKLAATTRPFAQSSTNPASRPDSADSPLDALDDVKKLIEDTIAPDSWKGAGGSIGTVRQESGRLVITQTLQNHMKIVAILHYLRQESSCPIQSPASATQRSK